MNDTLQLAPAIVPAFLDKETLDAMPDTELVCFVNREHARHLQCKPSEYESYVFDIDDGSDGNPARKRHHFYVIIYGCGRVRFDYTRKVFYHQIG